jgi:hypothetical protein
MISPFPSRRLFVLAACAGLLAACQSAPPRPTFPDIHFTDRAPIRLDAAALDVREEYRPSFRAPNVEHLFPVPPVRAASNWAHDRLQPTGRSGRAVFVIRNASVTETELPRTEGIRGAFTTEPAQRYDMALEATLQIVNDQGVVVRTASVKSIRTQSVLDNVTPNQREQAWYDMTKTIMEDFDAQMATEIRNNFGPYYIR